MLSRRRPASSVEVRGDDPEGIAEHVLAATGGRRADLRAFAALGAYRGERLLGGFLYTNYRPIADTGLYSVDMHMAGEPGWLTRSTLRAFFAYPFLQLNCSRLVGSIRADNAAARRVAEGIGCKLDGVVRSGISSELDTCIYTMTRPECLWIR